MINLELNIIDDLSELSRYGLYKVLLTYFQVIEGKYNPTSYVVLPDSKEVVTTFHAVRDRLILLPGLKPFFNKEKFLKNIFALYNKYQKISNPEVDSIRNSYGKLLEDSSNKELLNKFLVLLDYKILTLQDVEQTILEWQKRKSILVAYSLMLKAIFPSIFDQIEKISLTVALVRYGSIVSYSMPEIRNNILYIDILPRLDASFSNVLEGYVSSILPILLNSQDRRNWFFREKLVDLLLTKTSLAVFFNKYQPSTFNTDDSEDSEEFLNNLYKYSRNFLRKLGTTLGDEINIIDGYIYVRGINSGIKLTKKELIILDLLIMARGNIVPYF